MRGSRRLPRPEAGFLALAASFALFHHLPAFTGRTGDWIDLATPFAVVGCAGLVLASLRAAPAAVALALVAGVMYVDGHGIHLAANAIGREEVAGAAEDAVHFWDEVFGHIWWHLGWVLLLAAVALAERLAAVPRAWRPPSPGLAAAAVVLLGATLFTNGVEGGTWWLLAAAAAVFVAWAARAPRPLLVTSAGAFALASVLTAIWAIWQGGVPQFSDVGFL